MNGRPTSPRPPRAAPLLILLGGVLIFCGPLLWHASLPSGSDVYALGHYLQGFMKAFSEGDLFPRWTERTNQDLGAPAFVLFPPLVFYGAGFCSWIAGGIIGGLKLYLICLAALTALSFYLLAREWIGPGIAAALSAGLYLLLPYHVLDVYQRFAIPETTAFIFFPIILLFARRMIRAPARSAFLGLALGYAALIATHLVTAFMFSLLLGPWLLWETRARWRPLVPAAAGLMLGALLAAPILVPAALEKSQVNIAWIRETSNGDFMINFIFKDEVLPGLGFKDPVKPPVLRSAHSQLALALLAAGLGMAWLRRDDPGRLRDMRALAVVCASAYLLQLEISTPIWRIVPELATIQFPWRFQTFMVLTTALLAGYAIEAAGRPRGSVMAGLALLALVAGANIFLAGQNAFLKPFQFDEAAAQDPRVVSWSDPATTPVAFTRYRELKRMVIDTPRASFVEGRGEIRVTTWESSSRVLDVDAPEGGTVMLRTFWFPGWTGETAGAPLTLTPTASLGAITFKVPPGRHQVELRFGPTPTRRLAAFLGAGAALGLVVVLPLWPRLRPLATVRP